MSQVGTARGGDVEAAAAAVAESQPGLTRPRQATVFAACQRSCEAKGTSFSELVGFNRSACHAGAAHLGASRYGGQPSPKSADSRLANRSRERSERLAKVGGAARIRTGDGGFADLCLTTWLRRREDEPS